MKKLLVVLMVAVGAMSVGCDDSEGGANTSPDGGGGNANALTNCQPYALLCPSLNTVPSQICYNATATQCGYVYNGTTYRCQGCDTATGCESAANMFIAAACP